MKNPCEEVQNSPFQLSDMVAKTVSSAYEKYPLS